VAVASAAVSVTPGALPLGVAVGLVWGQLGGLSVTWLRHANARLVPQPTRAPRRSRDVTSAHALALLLDFARGATVTLSGLLVGRVVVGGFAAAWRLGPGYATGLLLVGGTVSAGILLRDLGGFRRRHALFATGMALGILGARLL
jgi:hypothetical protein